MLAGFELLGANERKGEKNKDSVCGLANGSVRMSLETGDVSEGNDE